MLNLQSGCFAVRHHRGYASKNILSTHKCFVPFPELQFVGQTDNIQSCKFVQTMEQRLQRAFQDAERKVWNTSNNLTVQVQRCTLWKFLLLKSLGYSLLCVCLYFNKMSSIATMEISFCFHLIQDHFVYYRKIYKCMIYRKL